MTKEKKAMDQKKIIKQMVEFNQSAFDNAFDAIVTIQDQTEQIADKMMDQADWLPEEGRKVIDNWVDVYKTSRNNFKVQVDNNYKQIEKLFTI
jgi:polyhydroxyalkanoate synthesis regulator phasin